MQGKLIQVRGGRAIGALVATLLAVATLVVARPVAVRAATNEYDPTFAAGFELAPLAGEFDQAAGIATDGSGRMIVGGTSSATSNVFGKPTFVRLTTDGAIDQTAYAPLDHRASVNLPEDARLLDFAMGPGDKIVGLAEGSGTKPKEYLFRLNPDGTLDTASDGDASTHFGTNGIVTITPSSTATFDSVNRVLVESNSQVVTAGDLVATSGGSLLAQVKGFSATGGASFSRHDSIGSEDSLLTDVGLSPAGDRVALLTRSRSPAGHFEMGVWVIATATGASDTTFSGDGKAAVASATVNTFPGALGYRFDGRLVIAGTQDGSTPDTLLAQFGTSGALDTTFDSDGLATYTTPHFNNITSLYTTSTSRYVVVGDQLSSALAAMRVLSNGPLDTGFDGDGVATFAPPSAFGLVRAIPATNGRTVIVGDAFTAGQIQTSTPAVLRLTGAGAGDSRFGNLAFPLYTAGNRPDSGKGITIAPDGGAVIIGSEGSSGATSPVIQKLLPNGYRDPGFEGGRVFLDPPVSDAQGRAVAVSGARPVFAGCGRCTSGNADFLVGRVTAAGDPDPAFSGDGFATIGFGSNSDDAANGVAVQSNGRVVVVGHAGPDFGVARFTSSGAPDASFGGGDGKVKTDIANGSTDEAFDAAIQSDGKIVVVGVRINATDARFVVARYTVAGVLDTTFGGGDGIVVSKMGNGSSKAVGVAIRPDGGIVVAGTESEASTIKIAIARYTGTGALDTSFNGTGKLVIAPDGRDTALDVAAVGNKIVITGGEGSDDDVLVARFLSSGAFDTTYGDGGEQRGPFGAPHANAIAVQADGAYVVTGGDPTSHNGLDTFAARFKP